MACASARNDIGGGWLQRHAAALPTDWYLTAYKSLTSCTEILHCVQNDPPGGKDGYAAPCFPYSTPALSVLVMYLAGMGLSKW